MDLPKMKKSEHGMFEGIKSKLGFTEASQDYYEDEYDSDCDGQEGGGYTGDHGGYGSGYRKEDNRSSTSEYGSYVPSTARGAGSTRNRVSLRPAGSSSPKLVSIDDVKARTQIPESLNRDPLPPRRSSFRGDRMMVESAMPASLNSPNARAAAVQDRERSESLNALFASTANSSSASSGFTSPVSASPRSLSVLKPASYNEAERIVKSLKAGEVVVLALRNTPDNLSKRILDFTFGVSCALNANVDCIADKVFVVVQGDPLTDAERTSLRNQGVV